MYIHLFLTDSCNLACNYCRGKIFDTPELERDEISFDADIPVDATYDLTDLYSFLSRDPGVVVTFIGGEPTLRSDLIIRIMEDLPDTRFMIQTNGILLHRLPSEIVNRFETILISIDGDKETTDTGRGLGTYQRVMDNIQNILANGYVGEIIARMTVHEPVDIQKSVLHLSHNAEYSFSSIHWQIDANFWNDFQIRNFESWVKKSYLPGIKHLAEEWVSRMEQTGVVERWYPFIDPVEDLLLKRSSRLRCGSGFANYTVLTNGQISPCPIMIGMADYYLGTITTADIRNLPDVPVPGACAVCDIRDLCGGRCLYSAVLEPWPQEGRELVCTTVRELFKVLSDLLPRIQYLLNTGVITMTDFNHEKYNGCEIIP
ncbi:TIGR04084 family radical SAM/SPASM domain-containing protein [Methanospirillum lacunae]|uniref:Putative peptide-modifying radical SAM/SPASM domain-containing protein n=1 Tax=Methanospirillum lacunae TaxID=668570 RepID=A0A2V2NE81_9EURY|nr:TIGR04084 family radical SAM/SPASM domain-containing protein [Methanospirillum lacunae]PWR74677.1 putative peptide-modifying radical SAM/SPASM domain-containing protein [Methanospirillum lacunae]